MMHSNACLPPCTDAKLIPCQHPLYLAHNRRFGQWHQKARAQQTADPFVVRFHRQLRFWESLVQRTLARFTTENPNRILRYCDAQRHAHYREIDYIAQAEENALTFCEIKLKQSAKCQEQTKALNQMHKTLHLAQTQYPNTKALLLVVDLSALLGTPKHLMPSQCTPLREIAKTLQNPKQESQTHYVDGTAIAQFAIQQGWITEEDIQDFKATRQYAQDPMQQYQAKTQNEVKNTPFAALKTQTAQWF